MDANSSTISRFKAQANKFSGILSKGLGNTNSIYILVQKKHAKPLWSKGAKNIIGLFYICKWYKTTGRLIKELIPNIFIK